MALPAALFGTWLNRRRHRGHGRTFMGGGGLLGLVMGALSLRRLYLSRRRG